MTTNTPRPLRRSNLFSRLSLREKKGAIFIALGAAVLLLLAACEPEPSPLYGTWADNRGNTFSFFDDNTFNARVVSSAGLPARNFSGNYTVLLNTLTLDCDDIDLRVVTEWDLRGNILYFNWITAEDGNMSLTLFKISN